MTNLGVLDCGNPAKTMTILTKQGLIVQPKPHCLNWICTDVECRRKKTELYLALDFIDKLVWIGRIPDKAWPKVQNLRKYHKRSNKDIHTVVVSYYLGDRTVASTVNLSPRDGFMVKGSNKAVIQQLAQTMIHDDVKCVSPAAKRVSRGGKRLAQGEPWTAAKIVMESGYNLIIGEVGEGAVFARPPGDLWEFEEAAVLMSGSLQTASLERVDNV